MSKQNYKEDIMLNLINQFKDVEKNKKAKAMFSVLNLDEKHSSFSCVGNAYDILTSIASLCNNVKKDNNKVDEMYLLLKIAEVIHDNLK